MCIHGSAAQRDACVVLLKELGRSDPYAKLLHAWLRWEPGPLKDHAHAQLLVDDVLNHPWPEWPKYQRAQNALGEAFRLKGLLLLRGEKVKHANGHALMHFKFAADKYLDGEASWLAAQCHARNPEPGLQHKAPPHALAHEWYANRAKEQGYWPEGEATVGARVQS